MLVVGLTGGIGSGKSTVAALFAEKNVPIIDTDVIARELTQPGQHAYQEIIHHFTHQILQKDKTIDRSKLRHIIFTHDSERHWLERLLHPLIREEMKRQTNFHQTPYCIIVIPLLTESTPDPIIQRILVVDTTEELQKSRVEERDRISADILSRILDSQSSREKRLKKADDVITNTGHLEELKAQVEDLHQRYLLLSKQS